jgi:hypothetical protein
MIGGIEETSASFEARSAPRSYPTSWRVSSSVRRGRTGHRDSRHRQDRPRWRRTVRPSSRPFSRSRCAARRPEPGSISRRTRQRNQYAPALSAGGLWLPSGLPYRKERGSGGSEPEHESGLTYLLMDPRELMQHSPYRHGDKNDRRMWNDFMERLIAGMLDDARQVEFQTPSPTKLTAPTRDWRLHLAHPILTYRRRTFTHRPCTALSIRSFASRTSCGAGNAIPPPSK